MLETVDYDLWFHTSQQEIYLDHRSGIWMNTCHLIHRNCNNYCFLTSCYILFSTVNIPYFFYIFDHLKIINFFADRIIGITPKLTENLEPNTNCIPDTPVHVCILIVKVWRCRTHITWVTFGYYRISFDDIRIKLFPISFVLKKTIAEE